MTNKQTKQSNKTIIIDTNAWMAVGKFHVPLFQELERIFGKTIIISTLQACLDELMKIQQNSKGKDKLAAKLVLQIIKQKIQGNELQLIPITGYADNLLISLSKKRNLVLTADKDLQKKLNKPYLIIKQQRYVELIE